MKGNIMFSEYEGLLTRYVVEEDTFCKMYLGELDSDGVMKIRATNDLYSILYEIDVTLKDGSLSGYKKCVGEFPIGHISLDSLRYMCKGFTTSVSGIIQNGKYFPLEV